MTNYIYKVYDDSSSVIERFFSSESKAYTFISKTLKQYIKLHKNEKYEGAQEKYGQYSKMLEEKNFKGLLKIFDLNIKKIKLQ
jgi:hypothetical protein